MDVDESEHTSTNDEGSKVQRQPLHEEIEKSNMNCDEAEADQHDEEAEHYDQIFLPGHNELRWGESSLTSFLDDNLQYDNEPNASKKKVEDSFNSSTVSTFSTSTIDSDVPPILPKRRTIRFAEDVIVREFNVTLGDNRLCMYPLTLSWNPSCEYSYGLDDYEEQRKQKIRKQQKRASPSLPSSSSPPSFSAMKSHLPSTQYAAKKLSVSERMRRLCCTGKTSRVDLMHSRRHRQIRLCMEFAYGQESSKEAFEAYTRLESKYIR